MKKKINDIWIRVIELEMGGYKDGIPRNNDNAFVVGSSAEDRIELGREAAYLEHAVKMPHEIEAVEKKNKVYYLYETVIHTRHSRHTHDIQA